VSLHCFRVFPWSLAIFSRHRFRPCCVACVVTVTPYIPSPPAFGRIFLIGAPLCFFSFGIHRPAASHSYVGMAFRHNIPASWPKSSCFVPARAVFGIRLCSSHPSHLVSDRLPYWGFHTCLSNRHCFRSREWGGAFAGNRPALGAHQACWDFPGHRTIIRVYVVCRVSLARACLGVVFIGFLKT
jgi:hypothetical protein